MILQTANDLDRAGSMPAARREPFPRCGPVNRRRHDDLILVELRLRPRAAAVSRMRSSMLPASL